MEMGWWANSVLREVPEGTTQVSQARKRWENEFLWTGNPGRRGPHGAPPLRALGWQKG